MLHIREQGQVRASTHISGPTTVDASGGQGPQPPRATTSCSLLLEQEVKDARTSATSAGARSVRTRCVRTGVKPPARGIDGSVHRHFHHDGRPHQDDIEEFRTAPPLRERPSLPRMGPVGQRQLAHHASRRPAGQDRAPSDAPQLPGGGRTGPAAGCAERTGGRTPRPRSPPWSPGPGTCASPLPWRLGPLPVPCRQVAIPCVLGLLGRAGWPTAGTVSADSSDAPRTTGSCRTGRSEQCGAALFHTQLTDVILPVLNNPHAGRLPTPRRRPAVSDLYGAARRTDAAPAPDATLRPPLRAPHPPPARPSSLDQRRQKLVREPERRQRPLQPARRQSPEQKRSPPSLRLFPTATHAPYPCCKSHITVKPLRLDRATPGSHSSRRTNQLR